MNFLIIIFWVFLFNTFNTNVFASDLSNLNSAIDKQVANALKEIGSAMQNTGADVTLPLEVVFIDRIAEFEKNIEPFFKCRIITAPLLPRDFGLSAEIRPGVIDTIKADFYHGLHSLTATSEM